MSVPPARHLTGLEVSKENGNGKYFFSSCYQIPIVMEFIKSSLGKDSGTEEIEEN